MKTRRIEKMNYKINIAGIAILAGIFLLGAIACEEPDLAPTFNYICVNGEFDATRNTTTEGEQRCVSCNDGFEIDTVSATCTGGFACSNGIPAPGLSPENAERCASCSEGYVLDDATATCASVYTCENGTPASGGSTTVNGANRCAECNAGYVLDAASNACVLGYTCQNGTPAPGASATIGENRCGGCNAGYSLDTGTNSCVAAYACINGDPAPGEAPVPGFFRCSGCDDAYTLNAGNGLCEPTLQFVCANGTPTPGAAPAADTTSCQVCNSGFRLVDSACVVSLIRLVGGSSLLEGRVEIFHNGQWGTVCDDAWDSFDAGVVCQELGYSRDGATAHLRAAFGAGTGPILLDNVLCFSHHNRLIDCNSNGIGVHNCGHHEDAGVTCLP